LATPGNLQADTLSELLFAISGAQPIYGLSYPLDQPARNDTHPKWLVDDADDDAASEPTNATGSSNTTRVLEHV